MNLLHLLKLIDTNVLLCLYHDLDSVYERGKVVGIWNDRDHYYELIGELLLLLLLGGDE